MRSHPFIRALGEVNVRQFAVGAGIAVLVTTVFASYRIATREELHMPAEWLTEAHQERLADTLSNLNGGDWRAGCVWERDDRSVDEVIEVPSDAAFNRATDGSMSFAVAEAAAAPGYDDVEGRGYFCYVPAS